MVRDLLEKLNKEEVLDVLQQSGVPLTKLHEKPKPFLIDLAVQEAEQNARIGEFAKLYQPKLDRRAKRRIRHS